MACISDNMNGISFLCPADGQPEWLKVPQQLDVAGIEAAVGQVGLHVPLLSAQALATHEVLEGQLGLQPVEQELGCLGGTILISIKILRTIH